MKSFRTHIVLLCIPLLTASLPAEEVDFHFENGQTVGIVEQVHGDLAYVSGLNGSAPVLSRLGVMKGVKFNGAKLEVIKVLERLLVARIVEENGEAVQASDRVVALPGDMAPQERMRALRVAYAAKVTKGPRMDGRLDDPVWQETRPIDGFVQRTPDYWIPGSERTVARIIYDSDKIYFGFECYDSTPQKVVANNMRRDSDLWGDDNVQILLDTYDDRQNGVFFFVNSLGAQQDMLLSQEGRTRNDDWDCIWETKARRHDKGWTAEVAIPFDQLRFKEGEDVVWGINLARYIASRNESVSLMVGRQSSSSLARYYMTHIAELRGLGSVKTEKMLQIKPYVLPGALRNSLAADPSTKTNTEAGVDLRYGLTPNMTLDLSYNTDFAQVEGDQEQVNLTQFQLFFPEKREFFLGGATLFDFGEAADTRGGDTRPPTVLFYSRRIGLEGGQPVPILLGSKVAGKAKRTSIGAMHVMMNSELLNDVSDYSILRMKQDVFDRSNIGFIFVNKQTDGIGDLDSYNRSGGVDFSYSPSTDLNVMGFYSRTWDSVIGDADDAGFLQLRYTGSTYSARLSYMNIEDNFEPAVGFVNRRRGLRALKRYLLEWSVRSRPRPRNIRTFLFRPRLRVFTTPDNQVKYWQGTFTTYTNFESGDWYRLEALRTYDVVDQPFRPSSRLSSGIPAGEYKNTTFRTGITGSRSRKIRPRFTIEAGTYYTGRRYRFTLENAIRPSGRISIETDYEANWLRLPEGNVSVHVLSNRLIYSFTTDFYLKVFSQFNNESESLSANFLLNYRFRPGSDLYLVYDQGYGTNGGLHERNRALLMKLSYMFGI